MLIYLKDTERLITVVEGTGDNLLPEDEKEGLVDYLKSSVYKQDGDELILEDGGQIMSTHYFADMETDEIVRRVLEYWEASDEDYVILNQ